MGRAALALLCLAAAGPATWLIALRAPTQVAASEAGPPAAAPTIDIDEELGAFVKGLKELRSGDESVLATLQQRAERLSAAGRPDVPEVLRFYAGLPVEERRAGLAAEERFEALWREVRAAPKKGLEKWPLRRAEILRELERITAERRGRADPTPAARCLALSARILEQRAREDRDLDEYERGELVVDAEAQAREALAIFERCGLLTPRLEPVWLLARLDEARGEPLLARDRFDQCVQLAKHVRNREFLELGLRGLVALAERSGDVYEQRDLLQQAADDLGLESHWWIARKWADLLLQDDEPGAAVRVLAQAKPTGSETPQERRDLAEWHLLFGSVLHRQGHAAEARAHFDEARRMRAELPGQASQADVGIARVEVLDGRPEAALALLDRTSAELLTAQSRALAEQMRGRALADLGRFEEAEAALRRALEIGAAVEARLQSSAGENLFGEVIGLDAVAALADVLVRRGAGFEAARVVEEFQTRKLRGESRAILSPEGLRAWAQEFDGGLLTWVISADKTVVLHVDSNGDTVAETLPIRREVLREAVRRVREAAIAGLEPRARALAAEVGSRVIPPSISARLAGSSRVLCLAHGPLEQMPFALLPEFDNGPTVLVLPGLVTDTPGPALRPEDLSRWSVLGDPVGGTGESLLPGSRAEAREVASMYGSEPLLGTAFTGLAVEDALRAGRPVHIATHLVRSKRTHALDEISLQASDSALSAREIQAHTAELPLVVLAACETAEGTFVDAQGLQSMSNAFVAAGARNLCVTLWPIADDAARAWSTAFHRALRAGERPSQAAAAARDALRASGTSVAEWAAFRFVGRD